MTRMSSEFCHFNKGSGWQMKWSLWILDTHITQTFDAVMQPVARLCHSGDSEPQCKMCKVRKAACRQKKKNSEQELSEPREIVSGARWCSVGPVSLSQLSWPIMMFVFALICVPCVSIETLRCVFFRLHLFMSQGCAATVNLSSCFAKCYFNHSAPLRADMAAVVQ